MTRMSAIALIAETYKGTVIVHCNGMISRESFTLGDSPCKFYMTGSMGLASSIALGIAIALPNQKVVSIDGDGNLLMGLGNLAMIGSTGPKNLVHFVLNNGIYGSTGSQKSIGKTFDFCAVALASGYKTALTASCELELTNVLGDSSAHEGPVLVEVIVDETTNTECARIHLRPEEISKRLRDFLLT